MTKKCGTCHHACRCREAMFAEVVAALEATVEALKSFEWEIDLGIFVRAERAIKKAKGEK